MACLRQPHHLACTNWETPPPSKHVTWWRKLTHRGITVHMHGNRWGDEVVRPLLGGVVSPCWAAAAW